MLRDRVALVTGGARGLGAAIVQAFAASGAVGAVVDIGAVDASVGVPPGWISRTADVTAETDVERVVAQTVAHFGRLDVVVANAGVVPPWSNVDELDLDALDRTLSVNVRGVAVTMKHGGRALRTGGGGAIVAMASLNAWHAAPSQSSYTASKHAVLGLVRTAALDLGEHGIRVNAIGPGPVLTEAFRERLDRRAAAGGAAVEDAKREAGRATALGRMVTPEEVAKVAVFLASDLASGVTGQLVPVDAGIP